MEKEGRSIDVMWCSAFRYLTREIDSHLYKRLGEEGLNRDHYEVSLMKFSWESLFACSDRKIEQLTAMNRRFGFFPNKSVRISGSICTNPPRPVSHVCALRFPAKVTHIMLQQTQSLIKCVVYLDLTVHR